MSFPPSASALAEALRYARSLRARIVHRQALSASRGRLWRPSTKPWRWNSDFPALYTSLSDNVALAERVKLSQDVPVRIVVASADATIHRVLDLTRYEVQSLLGVTGEALVSEPYDVTQILAEMLAHAGIGALVVPAALHLTAQLYPLFAVVRGTHRVVRTTPAAGSNVVLFTDNLTVRDRYPERRRFACQLVGIPAHLRHSFEGR